MSGSITLFIFSTTIDEYLIDKVTRSVPRRLSKCSLRGYVDENVQVDVQLSYETSDALYTGTCNYNNTLWYMRSMNNYWLMLISDLINQIWKWKKKHAYAIVHQNIYVYMYEQWTYEHKQPIVLGWVGCLCKVHLMFLWTINNARFFLHFHTETDRWKNTFLEQLELLHFLCLGMKHILFDYDCCRRHPWPCTHPSLAIDIEYNKRLDRQRPCLEGDFNGGSNNIVQSNKSVWRRW